MSGRLILVLESGFAVVVLSVLLGSEVGCGVSQAAMANTEDIPRTINNFFIDYYLQVTELLTGFVTQFFCHGKALKRDYIRKLLIIRHLGSVIGLSY